MAVDDVQSGELTTRAGSLTLAIAIMSTTLSVLPVFLVGALAILLRRDLDFTQAELGVVASAFYGVSALTSIPGGRLAQRWGPERAMAIGAGVSAVSLLGIAIGAVSWPTLFALLLVGGLGNAVAQPGANSAVARDTQPRRQGTNLGLLQTAIPLSTLLAGLAVPAIGLRLGWRWAFALAALAAVPVVIHGLRHRAPLRRDTAATRAQPPPIRKLPLYIIAAAGGFAAASANAMGAFYVESAVANGVAMGTAGLWLVVGSSCGVGGRLVWGWVVDRRGTDPSKFMTVLMLLGAVGFVMLGGSSITIFLLLGTVVAFGAGWAWKGLYNLTIVRQNRAWSSVALGISQAGVFAGSVMGPLLFGLLITHNTYRFAWTVSGSALVVAAVLTLLQKRFA